MNAFVQHSMIPFTRLDTARLQENLECDTPPAEDVAAMAEFLDIHPKDSLLVQEVWTVLLLVYHESRVCCGKSPHDIDNNFMSMSCCAKKAQSA